METKIILIILAATSISLVLGDRGLLKMAKDAKIKSERANVMRNGEGSKFSFLT